MEYQLDVIVPTHGRLDLTMQCLGALYENTFAPFHLIVVDDSVDLTPLYFADLLKTRNNITYIHSDVPYKSGNQIFNIGLANAKTEYVATVMNSIRVEPEWETTALELLRQKPKVGLVGLKCLLPSGRIESAGIQMVKWLPTDMGRELPGHRLSGLYSPDAVQWAFAIGRKSAMEGNLAEDVFHGFVGWDDIDNCFVLKDKGWKVLYCGQGVGYHAPRATRGNNSKEAEQKNRENGEVFYKRWGFWEEFQKSGPTDDIHRPPVLE